MTANSPAKSKETPLLVLEGDGIGPEITAATIAILKAADERFGLNLELDHAEIGLGSLAKVGTTFPPDVLDRARAAHGVILGPVSHNAYPPVTEGGINPSGALRKRLDLYANVRPARTRPAFPPRCGKPFDLVVVRENTEGFYSDRSMFVGNGEFMPTEDLALSIRKVSRKACIRIAECAFRIASGRHCRKVTAVHKANVLRTSDGLFLNCVREVAERYPDIEYEEQLVDAMVALLIRDAGRFDVIVTTNMFGDILSDQASEMSGSLGLAASINSGETNAMAQAQHGSAPDIAGQDIANPSSLIGSAAMLLDWLGDRRSEIAFKAAAAAIEKAIDITIADPANRTRDLGGTVGTAAFTRRVIEALTSRRDAANGLQEV